MFDSLNYLDFSEFDDISSRQFVCIIKWSLRFSYISRFFDGDVFLFSCEITNVSYSV